MIGLKQISFISKSLVRCYAAPAKAFSGGKLGGGVSSKIKRIKYTEIEANL